MKVVIVISDSYFSEMRTEHKDVLLYVIRYLEVYEMKMCGLSQARNFQGKLPSKAGRCHAHSRGTDFVMVLG